MYYKLDSIQQFIEYYDKGYRVDREDLMSIYKVSQNTFYRKIDYKNSPLTKVKIGYELKEKIKRAFSNRDERLVDDHIRVIEKRALFNEHEVFLHLWRTGNFEMHINVLGAGEPIYQRVDDLKPEELDILAFNYKAIKKYLWQAHRASVINALQSPNRYYNLADETDRTRFKRALKKIPHLKFIVCGVTSYVSLETGYYYNDSVRKNRKIGQSFLEDFRREQLIFELFNDRVVKDMENEYERRNQEVIEEIKSYLSTASIYKRNKFFRDNRHLGEDFLKHFEEYRNF